MALTSLNSVKLRSLLVGSILAGALSAHAAPVSIERIVAVVNSEIVLLSEAKDRAALLGQPVDSRGNQAERRQAEAALKPLVEKMVEDILVTQQATELKLSVDEAEVDRAADEVMKQNHLDKETFAQALEQQHFTLANYRRDLRRQLLRLKVINTAVRSRINVSDEEVKSFYEQNARQSGSHRQAHVRHVLVAVPAGSDDKEVESKRQVAAKVVELARGGTSFAELAKSYSDDAATKADGGDWGWMKQGESSSQVLEDVIFTMDQVNEVRGPIKTDRGFEVIQLLEKKEGDYRPFNEVKEQLRQQLYTSQLEKQTQSWLNELKKKAHIEYRL
jgi:parvulin-like peptidyl-prolyl isomerase